MFALLSLIIILPRYYGWKCRQFVGIGLKQESYATRCDVFFNYNTQRIGGIAQHYDYHNIYLTESLETMYL